ncbi:MAG: hypothetical protein PHP23_15025 [Desulfobacterales bacterium]|nr:hypothetical protein [Desulfobacterales bacterium]MDD4073474.1 hypothetical protein [Desulfobacterales bacterium]MDD4393728.1 hypothetical protein [Desulfobacterales bacterium]
MNNKGISVLKLILVILILLALAGGAFWGYQKAMNPSLKRVPLSNVSLKDEIVGFTFDMLPGLYQRLVSLDREISLIDQEINRLEKMGAEFPRQKNIITTEKSTWSGIRKDLIRFDSDFEKQLETLYVAYMVNRDRGASQMEQEKRQMIESADKALASSGKLTRRLEAEKDKNLLEQLKDKFL